MEQTISTQLHRDINSRIPFSSYIRSGAWALEAYNPKDERTHPAVKRIIKERGERAGFYLCDGMLFQLTVGYGEHKGVCSYYPVRGCSLADYAKIARAFGVTENEVNQIVLWSR